MNKRGAENLVTGTVIFLILNLLFFIVLLVFVQSAGSNYSVHEQTYAKQVALLIDNAKPGMVVLVNIEELTKLAKENRKEVDKIVRLNQDESKVIVSLKGDRGYSYKYFSDANVDLKITDNWLSVVVE